MDTKGELSRRVGMIVGNGVVTPGQRMKIVDAVENADSWDDLPEDVHTLLAEIEGRPGPGVEGD